MLAPARDLAEPGGGVGWGRRQLEGGTEGGHCAPASTRRAPTPPTAPTLPRGRPPLTRAERLGGGGRGPRGAGRADLLTSVCLGRGSAARQAPEARLEPDVPRRRSGRHRRGALARTGWSAHGQAGRAAAGAPGRAPPGFRGRPQTRGCGKAPPPPTSQRRRCPASKGKWPRHAGLPRVGSTEPAGLVSRGTDPSRKAQPLHAPYKGRGLFPPRPPSLFS